MYVNTHTYMPEKYLHFTYDVFCSCIPCLVCLNQIVYLKHSTVFLLKLRMWAMVMTQR